MWAILSAALMGFVPADGVLRDRVDVIEVNHFYDCQTGQYVFDQVIFWRFNGTAGRYEVAAWRMLRRVRGEVCEKELRAWRGDPLRHPPADPRWLGGHATPFLDHARRKYVSRWFDEKENVQREVTAPVRRETWTSYDPEIADRKIVPEHQRAGLRPASSMQR